MFGTFDGCVEKNFMKSLFDDILHVVRGEAMCHHLLVTLVKDVMFLCVTRIEDSTSPLLI